MFLHFVYVVLCHSIAQLKYKICIKKQKIVINNCFFREWVNFTKWKTVGSEFEHPLGPWLNNILHKTPKECS